MKNLNSDDELKKVFDQLKQVDANCVPGFEEMFDRKQIPNRLQFLQRLRNPLVLISSAVAIIFVVATSILYSLRDKPEDFANGSKPDRDDIATIEKSCDDFLGALHGHSPGDILDWHATSDQFLEPKPVLAEVKK